MPDSDVTLESPGESPASAPAPLAREPAPDTPASVAAKEASLREQLEATAGLIGSPAALDWSHLNGASAVQAGYKPEGPNLPDQLDVDPDTIGEPVLTRQGWVLPTNDRRARFGGR
jgi:hypothetical protein